MHYDDMAHMADQERKREREVGDGVEGNYGTVTVSLKQWREQNAELEKLKMDKTISVTLCNNFADEIARLREALETVRKWLTQKGLSPDEYDMVMDFIHQALSRKCNSCDGSGRAFANDPPTGYACEDCNGTGKVDEALAGAKGAEGGAETNDGEANAAEDSVGGSTGGTRPSKTEAEAGDHVGDDRVERSADNDSPTGPTPLSEPLCVTAPESTDAGCIRACMRMNKERIQQRYAEVVAAIAELRQEVERCKNRYDKLIPREFAETNRDRIAKMKENHQNKLDKMQEQIDSLSSRCRLLENEDQNQHDSLTDQGHAIDEHRLKIEALEKCVAMAAKMGWIFQDADDYQTYAEKIDAINKRLDEWEAKDKEGAEGIMGFIRMETERLDALTEAVLMLGSEVAIPKRKRETTIALNKLREKGESDG